MSVNSLSSRHYINFFPSMSTRDQHLQDPCPFTKFLSKISTTYIQKIKGAYHVTEVESIHIQQA